MKMLVDDKYLKYTPLDGIWKKLHDQSRIPWHSRNRCGQYMIIFLGFSSFSFISRRLKQLR